MKKKVCFALMLKSQNGQRVMYNRWSRLTKDDLFAKKCRQTESSFLSTNILIKSILDSYVLNKIK